MTILRSPRLASIALAVFLAGLALAQLQLGPDSTPAPMREIIVWLFGYGPELAARLIVAVELAAAAAVLVAGTRFLALLVAGAAVFFALACVSRAVTGGGLLWPIVSLALALGILLYARASRPSPPREGRRGLSPAWPALGAIAAATLAGQWTASASFADPAAKAASAKAPARPTAPSIDLDMRAFEGKPLSESVLAKHLPQVVELCATQDAYVVVYSPYCESCHTLFRDIFSVPRPERVIAVAVPMSDDAVSAATEEPRPIECLDCDELSLPKGPNWIVAPPMVLKVQGGVVTCVADRLGGDCLPK
ncbi:MAG: hypothetical protein RLY21_2361 [Planctomycetota bacterium]|jgi:hypothetical protein